MLIDIVQRKGRVEVSFVDKTGQIELTSIPTTFENWVKCDEDDPQKSKKYRNWTGEPVKKVHDREFKDLNLREFLLHKVPKDIQEKIFAYNKPNWYAVDIEVDVRNCNGFPEPTKAEHPISTIQVTNQQLSTVLLIFDDMNRIEGTQEYKDFISERVRKHFQSSKKAQDLINKYAKDGVLKYEHIVVKSERELLKVYFALQKKSMHHIMGWNWLDFDSPYIHKRAVKNNVNHSMASPVGELVNREISRDKFAKHKDSEKTKEDLEQERKERTFSTPRHRVEVDLMQVINKFDYSIDKTSLALDAIGYQAVDVPKIKYDGSFRDLFLDTDNFLTYSAVDTILLMMVHLRLNTITSLEMVTYYSKIPLERGFSTLALGDAMFWDEQFSNGLVFCHEDRYSDDDDGDTDFEGGYVINPRYATGEWVALVDFKSLYPTCGQSLGCSFDNIIKENATDEEIKEAIKLGHRVSMNRTIYDKDDDGTLTRVWNRLIYERYHFKDIRLFIDNKMQPVIKKMIEAHG
ncbi:DNA polymerase [Tenacibaculum phage pT24]|uniref:DNA-directed DNA polymerase n=1 Tax=Tenacibaculum phage pT24 TaxID=1880590 RepID=A0A1B4XWV0_9CAUD|nr:DNA polymerase [Tenacibaculum phage pT24]BAV39291.1 DNA polymerase [Tenacibaculum phage pT24]